MIKILNDDTIQKIAAGEVVERPVSIIKELVENSIDAMSTEIIVEIKNGGKSYIKVSDNGAGIPADQIDLAFTRHATSKISDFDDLYKVFSMGFRGEALASIVSVSNLSIVTKTKEALLGIKTFFEHGKKITEKKIATNNGTTIEVHDLFKYIPARHKFLASDITEANKITQLMYTFAIGNPNISFTYLKDNKEVFVTNSNNNKLLNFEILFGKEFIKNSHDLSVKSDNYKISGRISNNRHYKGNRSMQFIYVNGRYIENEDITAVIEKAYYSLIPSGRFPIFEIQISVNPEMIDVNIHPNKQKIKFSLPDELYDLLQNSILDILYKKDKEKTIEKKDNKEEKISFHKLNSDDSYKRILDSYKTPEAKLNRFDKNQFKESTIDYVNLVDLDDNISAPENEVFSLNEDTESIEESSLQIQIDLKEINFNTVLFNKYIIFDNKKNKNIKIIDINKANTRIIYDNLNENDEIKIQQLLEPIIISVSKKDIVMFEQNTEKFEKLGYETSVFGDDKIIIRAIPYYLDNPTTKEDFIQLLDTLKAGNNKSQFLLRKSISLAINKSKNITDSEAELLFEELMKTSNPYTDPSGNTIIYDLDELNFSKILKG